MSMWSAIGLADRKAVERLMGQIENLQEENRKLISVNQRLILEQLNDKYTELSTAENQNTQHLVSRIQKLQEELRLQLESMSHAAYQRISADGESTRKTLSLTKQKLEDDMSKIYTAVNNLAKMTEVAKDEMKTAFSSEAAQLEQAKAHLERKISVEGDSSRKALAQLNAQVIDGLSSVTESILERQQQLSSDSCEFIANANRDFVSRVEQYSISTLEEVKDTAEKYRRMEQDEQESLDKIRTFSDEMLELGEHQKKVMERLSQLCQDSDQFMEIQKSINDMWEIMKAVWVDSLLNNYNNSLNGNSEK